MTNTHKKILIKINTENTTKSNFKYYKKNLNDAKITN